jgi:hypothetical protein
MQLDGYYEIIAFTVLYLMTSHTFIVFHRYT